MTDLYIGIMSGTSLDGADAVLADFSGARPVQIVHAHRSFADGLRAELLSLCASGNDEIHRSQQAAIALGHEYSKLVGDALLTAGVPAEDVQAIGCHGQTVRHMPAQGYSLQLNAPALIAEQTGIRVVADFRMRDIAAGGQGAPLVPAFHAWMFSDEQLTRAILNVGGMSNLTLLAPGKPVRGFDCGPGNVLMDGWIEQTCGLRYDAGGKWARSGRVNQQLLDRMKSHPFFALPPPKSCGREQFNLGWLQARIPPGCPAEDVQATLCEFTAQAVKDALQASRFCADEIAVCGGGAFNDLLMDRLLANTGTRVLNTSEWGVPPESIEALAFAWLARCALRGEAGNLPEVTGAAGFRVLGAVWHA
jgi:anhydro-N-acetylmuramic acid kinase